MARGEVRYRLTLDSRGWTDGLKASERDYKGFKSQVEGGVRVDPLINAFGQAQQKVTGLRAEFQAFTGTLKNTIGMSTGLGAGFAVGATAATALLGVVTQLPGAIARAAAETVALSGRLSDAAKKADVSAESLQRWSFTGKASVDQIAAAIVQLKNRMVETPEAFDLLGLRAEKLRDMNMDQVFELVGQRLLEIRDPAQQTAAAMDVLGKSGADMLPLLKNGLLGSADAAERLGAVMSDKTVGANDALGDSATKLSNAIEGLKNNLVSIVTTSPAILAAIEGIAEAVGLLSRAARDLQESGFGSIIARGVLAVGTFGASEALLGMGRVGHAYSQEDFENYRSGPRVGPFVPHEVDRSPLFSESEWSRIVGPERLAAVRAQIAEADRASEAAARSATAAAKKAAANIEKGLVGMSKEFEGLEDLGARAVKEIQAQFGVGAPGPPWLAAPHLTARMTKAPWQRGTDYAFGGLGGGFGLLAGIGHDLAVQQAAKQTATWDEQLQRLAQTMQGLPGLTGKLGQALIGFATSIASIGSALKGGISFKGGVGGFLGGLGGVLGIAGAAAGIFGGLKSLFGGKSKEEEAQRRQAQQDAIGQVQQLAQRWEDFRRKTLEGGVGALGSVFDYVAKQTDVSAERLQRLGLVGTAMFASLRASGMGFVDALKLMGPTLEKAQAAGVDISGGGAFGSLTDFQAKVGANQELVTAAESWGKVIDSLRVTGSLTAESFGAAQLEANAFYDELIEKGFAGNQALAVLAPTLFSIAEASRATGLAVDETTQSLINQANQAGLFEGMKDPMAEILEIQKLQLEVTAALAKAFGATLPDSVKKYLDSLAAIPKNVSTNVDINYRSSGTPPPLGNPVTGESFASGTLNRQFNPRRGGHWLNVAEAGRAEYVTVTHEPVSLFMNGRVVRGRRLPPGVTHAAGGLFTREGGGRDRDPRERDPITGSGSTGGGDSDGGTATTPTVETAPEVLAKAIAAEVASAVADVVAASKPQVSVTSSQTVVVRDESLVKTAEGVREWETRTLALMDRALRNNTAGLVTRIKEVVNS